MVTTSTEGPKSIPVPPFAEHDKLGPLGTKTSVLHNEAELRRALVNEFLATADAAREAAGKADKSVTEAVHEYRKALRRARAVLSLVADALPKSERRAVRRALQEARRALSTARDHAVAPETLSHLQLGEVERETANAILATAREAMPATPELRQLLAEGAARAAAQVEALEAALPTTIEWDTVAKGVRSVYDAARRARKAGKRSKRQFHTWRRRSKELTYQLELLSGYAGVATTELHHEIEGVTDAQGPAVDLIMLRDFVRTYGDGVAREAFDGLMMAIDAQLDDLMRDSRSAGKVAFKRKPKKFTRRLTKLVHKDLAPATAGDELPGD
jgi:CHAD domain-containing protein